MGAGGVSYTKTETVSGNGTYTAGDALATMGIGAQTYLFSAVNTDESTNDRAKDQGGTSEQTVVSAANPSVTTTASGAVTLGTTAPTLSDSAVLSGEIGRASCRDRA